MGQPQIKTVKQADTNDIHVEPLYVNHGRVFRGMGFWHGNSSYRMLVHPAHIVQFVLRLLEYTTADDMKLVVDTLNQKIFDMGRKREDESKGDCRSDLSGQDD